VQNTISQYLVMVGGGDDNGDQEKRIAIGDVIDERGGDGVVCRKGGDGIRAEMEHGESGDTEAVHFRQCADCNPPPPVPSPAVRSSSATESSMRHWQVTRFVRHYFP
jgi:hypothetical protein